MFSDEQAESLLNSPWIYSTKHYSNYKGDLQKDSDLMASSPESTTRSNEQSTHLPTMETIDTVIISQYTLYPSKAMFIFIDLFTHRI